VNEISDQLQEKAQRSDITFLRSAIENIRGETNFASQINELEMEIYRQRSLLENMQHDLGKVHNEQLTFRDFTQFAQETQHSTKEEIWNTFKT
jgi:hypothetical protein